MNILNMACYGGASAIISFASSVLIVLSQHWHGKHSLDHDLTGVQKFHAIAVPRIGGIAVMTGLIFATLLCFITGPANGNAIGILDVFKLILASCPIFFVGTLEDLTKKVSVKSRLGASVLSALLASWLLGATVHGLDIWGLDRLLIIMPIAVVVTAFLVAGGTNAINIIDGFHGISATVVIIMLAALGFLAWRCGDALVTQTALLAGGAVFGFLLVNYPTGRLFVGDGGAYLSGFLVSEVMVLLLTRNPSISAWQVLGICAYPVIEVLYSIYRRKIIRKMSPGHADGLHLHTLIYRRVVCQRLRHNPARPWLRNAAVVCFIGPWVAVMSVFAVFAGDTIPNALIIVVAQVVLYMAIYTRLVRGYWGRRSVRACSTSLLIVADVELPH
ncbi:glycosyltransferase [Glaciimonas sp. PAMC28666]|uniref:MraY family glycosyltransferase n=1 Tax=Glaciimonas sp. PAMC28666 TaxID=2807626 RepID=UPI001964ABE6|nr:glycosyltransferase [Glaciimonas sp. PAMC28666]QRX81932.1 glycosyltransferase family 4 protein [Glaciimonas sp. PAMC28666]